MPTTTGASSLRGKITVQKRQSLVRQVAILTASVSLIALAPAYQASAQQTAQAASADSSSELEEIVVTARRREEKIQTVPLAITAFTQTDIEKQHIQQVSDLTKQVPSLAVMTNTSDTLGSHAFTISLRGLPGTVAYFADVPLGGPNTEAYGFSNGLYYDLDNLEVINGPQGTLFGKNSIGGLISIEPKHPMNDFEGYVKATFGNYGDREFEGAVNIPIVQDKVLLRIAGQSQQRDGYTKDLSNGKDLDNRNYFSWRVGLTLRPTDDFENYFLYDGYWQDSNGGSTIVRYVNPGAVLSQISLPILGKVPLTLGQGLPISALENPATAGATFGELFAIKAAGGTPSLAFYPQIASLAAEQQALGVRTELGNSDHQDIAKYYYYGFTDVATWDVNDNLTIKNIAAARFYKQVYSSDFVPLGVPIEIINFSPNGGWNTNDGRFTEEFQVQGKALDGKLNWVAGGYLEYDGPVGSTLEGGNTLGSLNYTAYRNSDRSQAVFAHGVYDLSDSVVDGLRLTAGYRYTWDYVSDEETGTTTVPYVTRNAAGAPTNCQSALGIDNNCFSGVSQHFSAYGWNVGLDEQLTPDVLIYLRSGNAYRPGGVTLNAPPDISHFQPEHVTDVELGEKADFTLWGIKSRVNADIYHTDYKSIQESGFFTTPLPNGSLYTGQYTVNAATATVNGAEFKGDFLPVENVTISPHFSYTDGHYSKFPPGIAYTASPPFGLPRTQWGVTGSYHVPWDSSLGSLDIAATYSWTGAQLYDLQANPLVTKIPSFSLLNLRVDWTNVFEQPIDVAFFMTNALDTTYATGGVPLYGFLGVDGFSYGEPRMFGFSVKYRFGGPSEESPEPAAYTPPPAVAPAPAMAPRSYLVFFDFNKSDLTPQAQTIVNQAAANAGPAKVTQLTVTGHTDTVGSDAYNMRLSRRRAESVAAQLEKDGIASSEIQIVAKGKRDLLVPTADGVKEPQNRRVQIVYDGGPTS